MEMNVGWEVVVENYEWPTGIFLAAKRGKEWQEPKQCHIDLQKTCECGDGHQLAHALVSASGKLSYRKRHRSYQDRACIHLSST
jgi:hypothetical protein